MAFTIFQKIHAFKVHTDFVKHIEKIDQRRFCTGGDDGIVMVFDIESCKELFVLKGHRLPITAMHRLAPQEDSDNKSSTTSHILATSSADRKIILWDVDKGSILRELPGLNSAAKCLASFGKYPRYIVSGGDRLVIWDTEGPFMNTCVPSLTEYVRFMIILHDSYMVVAIDDHLAVQFVHLLPDEVPSFEPKMLKLKSHREAVSSLVKVNDDFFLSGSLDGVILHWSVGSWECVGSYNYVAQYLGQMKVYPYSVQYLHVFQEDFLIAGIGRGFTIFNLATKTSLFTVEDAHVSKINYIDVIYDGQFIATCSEDSTIKIWKVLQEGESYTVAPMIDILRKPAIKVELQETCSFHSASVMKCMSAGSNKFISCGNDRQVVLWMDGFAEEQAEYQQLRKFMPY